MRVVKLVAHLQGPCIAQRQVLRQTWCLEDHRPLLLVWLIQIIMSRSRACNLHQEHQDCRLGHLQGVWRDHPLAWGDLHQIWWIHLCEVHHQAWFAQWDLHQDSKEVVHLLEISWQIMHQLHHRCHNSNLRRKHQECSNRTIWYLNNKLSLKLARHRRQCRCNLSSHKLLKNNLVIQAKVMILLHS